MDMAEIDRQYTEWITPKHPLNYTMRTRDAMQMSSGVAWTADLIDPDGVTVGDIEQEGHGGSDRVDVFDRTHYDAWKQAVMHSYGKFDEEAATAWLMAKEDGEV